MNRQTADKIQLFMSGLRGRIGSVDQDISADGSADVSYPIEEIEAEFKSGLKKYKLTAPVVPGGILKYNFGGNSYESDYDGFVKFIAARVPDYDELILVYRDAEKESMIIATQTK